MMQTSVRSARPEPWTRLLSPAALVRDLWSCRDLIRQFSLRYFQQRYRGTQLGMGWALLVPLLMLTVYTFVFGVVFTSRGGGAQADETRAQYAVWVFCGMVVFAIFAEGVVRSCSLVFENPNYVTKVVFPLQVLPVASLGSTLLFSLFGFGLVVAGAAIFHGSLHATALLTPLVMLPLVAMTLGLSWFLSALAVFVRDVTNIASLLVGNVLFFLTPIFYRVESVPEQIRPLLAWNPAAVVVEGVRACVLEGRQPAWGALAVAGAAGLVMMQLGYAFFMKARRGFADVL
jgi:lipopolysaccharide transport system permease protein